jgi:hypothetical protein
MSFKTASLLTFAFALVLTLKSHQTLAQELPAKVAHESSCQELQTLLKESDVRLTYKSRNLFGRRVLITKIISSHKPDCFYPDYLEQNYYRTNDRRSCALDYKCVFEID